jgi:hypothetical protein
MSKFLGPALFCCSVAMGAALFFFSLGGMAGFEGFEGFAALALEDRVPDRETAEVLEEALGRPVISESSQWVLLNSFGSLERIPLDDYGDRLESFDPRRDGYAEKLTEFFVRDGKRWFFIPLDRELFGPLPVLDPAGNLGKRIAAALGAPSLAQSTAQLEMKRGGRSPLFHILLFVLAWGAALFLAAGGRVRRGFRGPGGFRPFRGPPGRSGALLLLAPVMLPLCLWGTSGFAFLALFLLLGALLSEPVREWWIHLRRGPAAYRAGGRRFLRALPLVPLLALIPWIGGIAPLPAAFGFFAFALIYVCSLGLETRRRFAASGLRAPVRFAPIPILPRTLNFPFTGGRGSLFPGGAGPNLMLPFALASCVAAFSGPLAGVFRSPGDSPAAWPFLVREEDYRSHALFQAGFAYRSLQAPGEGSGYFRYILGEDGLVAGELPTAVLMEGGEIPPFPLAELSDFLAAWGPESGGRGASSLWAGPPLADLVSPVLVFLLAFPPLVRGRLLKKVPAYCDKRIAA